MHQAGFAWYLYSHSMATGTRVSMVKSRIIRPSAVCCSRTVSFSTLSAATTTLAMTSTQAAVGSGWRPTRCTVSPGTSERLPVPARDTGSHRPGLRDVPTSAFAVHVHAETTCINSRMFNRRSAQKKPSHRGVLSLPRQGLLCLLRPAQHTQLTRKHSAGPSASQANEIPSQPGTQEDTEDLHPLVRVAEGTLLQVFNSYPNLGKPKHKQAVVCKPRL